MGSNQGFYTGKDGGDFSQIVLNYLNKILDILSKELRDKHTIIPQSGSRAEMVIEEEDTRISFVQAVEGLSTILTPWFDKETEESFEVFDLVVNATRSGYYIEYKKNIDEEFEAQKKIGINNFEEADQNFVDIYREWSKVLQGKKMFRQLNKLLHSNDYLKGSVYGEGLDVE